MMRRNKPTLGWLESLQIQEVQGQRWIEGEQNTISLDSWYCLPLQGPLSRDENYLESLLEQLCQETEQMNPAASPVSLPFYADLHIQAHQTPAFCQSAPTGYPWDGVAQLNPGQIPSSLVSNPGENRQNSIPHHAVHQNISQNLMPLGQYPDCSGKIKKDIQHGSHQIHSGCPCPGLAEGFWLVNSSICLSSEQLEKVQDESMFWQLGLQGIQGAVYVYINGQFAGMTKGHSGSVSFRLNEGLKEGKNQLALLCLPFCAESWLDCGSFVYGLSRACIAVIPREAWIDNLQIRTEISADLEEARIWLDIQKDGTSVNKHIWLEDPAGQTVLDFESDGSLLALDLCDLQLWSMEIPSLYTLHMDFPGSSGNILRSIVRKIGLRRLEERHGTWRMNGKRLLLKGLQLKPDYFCMFADEAALRQAFTVWKQEQVNAVSVHQILDPSILAMADTYGIAVVVDLDIHTGEFPRTRQGFERLWKKSLNWRIRYQQLLISEYASVIALRLQKTVFSEDTEQDLIRHFDGQHSLLIGGTRDKEEACWLPFLSLQQAKRQMSEYWERPVVFAGNLNMEDFDALYPQASFGGCFLNLQQDPAVFDGDIQNIYTPWRLSFEKRGIRVENRNEFRSGRGYKIVWTILKNNIPEQKEQLLNLPAQSVKRIFLQRSLDPASLTGAGILSSDLDMHSPRWLYEAVLERNSWQQDGSAAENPGTFSYVFGEKQTGIYGEGFSLLFDPTGLCSLQVDHHQLLSGRPELTMISPVHKSSSDLVWAAAWDLARPPRLKRTGNGSLAVALQYDYVIPTIPASRCSIAYTISASGLIGVDAAVKQSSELPALSYFGWSIPLIKPMTLRVQTGRDVYRISSAALRQFDHTEFVKAAWNSGVMVLSKIQEPLQTTIASVNTASLRFGQLSAVDQEREHTSITWITVAPEKLEPLPSLVPDDAFIRYQFSFLIDLKAVSHAGFLHSRRDRAHEEQKAGSIEINSIHLSDSEAQSYSGFESGKGSANTTNKEKEAADDDSQR